ncbi:RecB family exonuclease [Changpingibacter yushuensis]|uniref:RecB family exonuclease n=1 Tax=Changpingibacter yushuensis TaxID=2758440 RepID=UPI0015F4BC54|nr:PD-(D/E)XK nuclease family protein [Changpingibacter yushuensis]
MNQLDQVGGLLCHSGTPSFTFTDSGIELTDTAIGVIRRKKWSVSAMKAQHGCRARFGVEKLVPWRVVPHSPAHIGTVFHSVMENLAGLPGPARTPDKAAALITDMIRREIRAGVLTDDDMVAYTDRVRPLVTRMFEIENVAAIDTFACEKWVNLTISGVPFTGAVDRLDTTSTGGLKVVDYKTGKVPNLRFGDDHGDQLRVYAWAVPRVLKREVDEAFLYYPAAPTRADTVRQVDLSEDAVARVIDDIPATYAQHMKDMTDAFLPFETGPLCAWCPLSALCPAAHAAGIQPSERYDGALDPAQTGLLTPTPAIVTPEPAPNPDDELPRQALDRLRPTPAHTEREGKDTIMPIFDEAKPWEETRGVNANAYSTATAFGLIALAAEKLHEQGQGAVMEDVEALAGTFDWMIHAVASKVSQTDDPEAGIHTRLSGALRTSLLIHPIPTTFEVADWKAWQKTTAKTMLTVCGIAYDMCDAKTPKTNAIISYLS